MNYGTFSPFVSSGLQFGDIFKIVEAYKYLEVLEFRYELFPLLLRNNIEQRSLAILTLCIFWSKKTVQCYQQYYSECKINKPVFSFLIKVRE